MKLSVVAATAFTIATKAVAGANIWTPVYGFGTGCNDASVPCGVPMTRASFDEIWKTSPSQIMRWQCYDCGSARGPVSYYKRYDENNNVPFDLLFVMLQHFTDGEGAAYQNTLGTHFNIFSSHEDALKDVNPWEVCSYNLYGAGFPRDCGKTGITGNWQLISVNRSTGAKVLPGGRNNWVLSVETDSTITPEPTKNPTRQPTKAPTRNPTSSPTETPGWEITYQNMTANFAASSTEELVLEYIVSKNRQYETAVLQKDCSTNITDIQITLTDNLSNVDSTHSMLKLSYNFDKSSIATATSIWDSVNEKIELCQVVRLVEPAAGPQPKMVVSEDRHVVSVDFDLSVDFEFDNAVQGAEAETDGATTDVNDYVKACKCNGAVPFVCNNDPLPPNEELHICIASSSSDIVVGSVTSMIAEQGETSTLNVIEDSDVKYSSFSSIEEINEENGYKVNLRLPTNLFDFGGPNITISGSLEMEFVNGGLRKLRALSSDSQAAPFALEISLTNEAPAEINDAKAAEEVKSAPGYLMPLLVVVGLVSLLAMAGIGMAFRARRGIRSSVDV